MRTIPSSLDSKFKKLVQAESTKAAPAVDLWISRPVVPLVNDYFLEQQAIGNGNNVTALDIAVAHPRHRRQSTKIYIATVENGRAKVVSSPFRQAMETHVWTDCGFSEDAEDVAVAFDAVMKNDTRGRSEFVTDELPWVFWVNSGALYGQQLGSNEVLTLAEANCTKCTAIRAAGSALGGFDYGLCLFFLLNGEIYVRQRINGEWMDAEPVNFGPGVTWRDIAASRSWDYRVVLQAMATDGTVYELFTQYMGIGQRGTEHIEVKKVEAKGKLTEIKAVEAVDNEHIELAAINAGALYGGLYSALQPVFRVQNAPVDAFDSEGNAYQDWGKVVLAISSVHLDVSTVGENFGNFIMTDSTGKTFAVAAVELDKSDGMTLRLTFADFNSADGSCVLTYTPGTLTSMAGTAVESAAVEFVPENLVKPEISPPEPVEAFIGAEDGTVINIRFSQPVVSGVTESASAFSATVPILTDVGGIFGKTERTKIPASVSGYKSDDIVVQLENGDFQNTAFDRGRLTLAKEGEGT